MEYIDSIEAYDAETGGSSKDSGISRWCKWAKRETWMSGRKIGPEEKSVTLFLFHFFSLKEREAEGTSM